REWLGARLQCEQAGCERHQHFTLRQAFVEPRILLLCTTDLLNALSFYSLGFWTPLILKSRSGWSDPVVSTLGRLPSLAAASGMLVVAAHSDRTGERRRHVACAAGVGAIGLAASGWVHSPVLTLVTFSIALTGVLSVPGPFWALSTSILSPAVAAG